MSIAQTGQMWTHECRAERIQGFIASHSGVQGIAVLAFEANNVDQIHDNYLKTNEKLIASYSQHDESTGSQCKVLEVYAYYVEDSSASTRTSQKVDPGTVLRFVERTGSNEGSSGCLPGIDKVEAQFHKSSRPVYCDHWVSNVFSRTDFLETLHETLGFVTKVSNGMNPRETLNSTSKHKTGRFQCWHCCSWRSPDRKYSDWQQLSLFQSPPWRRVERSKPGVSSDK